MSSRRVEKTGFIQLLCGRRKATILQRVPAQVDALSGEWMAEEWSRAGGETSALPEEPYVARVTLSCVQTTSSRHLHRGSAVVVVTEFVSDGHME